jgi:hypothetical protein
MSSVEAKKIGNDCLSASWLAERFAVDPARIDAMRRGGELIAVRDEDSTGWAYPTWQLEGRDPRHVVPRIVQAARESGLDETRLYDVLTAPLGLRGDRRLVDLILEGRDDEVVQAVRTTKP